MIFIFRKEIRKWYPILWLVFISLAISGIYGFFFKSPGNDVAIGKVNGTKILFGQYRQSLSEIYHRLENIKNYARQYGISAEMFVAGILGGRSPEQFAQDQCVHDALVDEVKNSVNPQLDPAWFKDELIKMFPQGIVNEQGVINMEIYRGYLQKMGTNPAQFEEEKEEAFKRTLILNFVQNFEYTPEHEIMQDFEQKNSSKSFSILAFNVNNFIKKARAESVDEKELELFYQRHKESYRIPEQRKAIYWVIDPQAYGASLDVDEEMVTRFYERNKSTMFRNPPTVTIKRIALEATKDNRSKVYEQAKEFHARIKKNADDFEEIAAKHSSLKKDKLELTISGRGEHDSDIESAAFRLNKVGDISPVVRTMKGYEILKLIKRIPAADRPFETVREEIVKTLKARRALGKLKSDLEALVRNAKNDEAFVNDFVSTNKLEEKRTDWLSNSQANEKSLEAELIKKMFTRNQSGFSFIQYENSFVLFKVADLQPSEIPSFEKIKDSVTEDFFQNRGLDLLKNSLRQAKAELLNKTATPEELANKVDARFISTGLISQGANSGTTVKELKHIPGLKPRIFTLTSPEQVFSYQHQDDHLLVQVQEVVPSKDVTFDQERAKFIKKEKMKGSASIADAFIASLYRNAKIEFDEHLLGINKYK